MFKITQNNINTDSKLIYIGPPKTSYFFHLSSQYSPSLLTEMTLAG